MSTRSGQRLGLAQFWSKHRGSFTTSLGVTLVALLLYAVTFIGERPTLEFDFIQRLEQATLDLRFQGRYKLQDESGADPRIVVVDIDQASQEKLGRWPFPRSNFAAMLDALREDGARVVGFDITFSKPDDTVKLLLDVQARLRAQSPRGEESDSRSKSQLQKLLDEFNHDRRFAHSIRAFTESRAEQGGGVVLGNFFLYSTADLQGVSEAALDRDANLIWEYALGQVRPSDTAQGPESRTNMVQLFDDAALTPRGAQANMEMLMEPLRGDHGAVGFFNVIADPDGVVRRSNLLLPYGRSGKPEDADLYGSLDLQAARLFLGVPEPEMMVLYGRDGVEDIRFGDKLRLKPDKLGRILINYQGPVRTYKYVSMGDVVGKKFEPGTFKDKIVLVGASATGIGDLRSTPFGSLDYPGVEIHANVIDNLLNQKFMVRGGAQVLVDLGLILLFGIPLGIALAIVDPKRMPLALLLMAPLGAFWYYGFDRGWVLNVIMPLGTLLANTGLTALYRVLIEEKEKRKVRGAFQQYLSPEVIRRLLENPDLVQPRKVELSVMFSDIRGFTSISEKLDAQDLALFLNDYLSDMTRIVFRNRGTLDKYIGDAVMAFWGAPFEEQGHPQGACAAALDMMDRMHELQAEWERQGKPKLDIGLGINTGIASVGNMGSNLRYGYTAMGDAVNLASRLEGLNKEYGTHIIVSESTFAGANVPEFIFRELDLIRVKGKLQPVMIYELLGRRDGDKTRDLEELAALFAEGRKLYQQREWQEAQNKFEEILDRWENDGPARNYWKRCQEYMFEEPPPAWDGVFVMTHK